MLCHMNEIPFTVDMVTGKGWDELQRLANGWVTYFKLEFPDLIKAKSNAGEIMCQYAINIKKLEEAADAKTVETIGKGKEKVT